MDVARGHPVHTGPVGRRDRAASVPGVEALGARALGVAAVWAAGAGCLAAAGLLQGRLVAAGRSDLAVAGPVAVVYTLGFVVSAAVGGALVIRRRGGPVGGLFLLLASAQVGGLALDLYARYGALARPGAVPGAPLAAHVVDPVFLVFFATMGVALHLIPTGRTLGRRWAWAARATVAAATAAYVGGVVSDRAIDPPFGAVANPLAVPGLSGPADVARAVGAMGTAAGLVVGGASVIVRYRRSAAPDRHQLRWLVAAVLPLPVYLALAFAWRRANNETPLLVATAGWTVVIPAATWWCISRRRLFDMDGVLSAGVAYLLSTGVVVATYAATVVVAGDALSGFTGSATTAPVVATLAAVSVIAPARRRIQDLVDRRFNRRRFDALRLVEAHLADPAGTRPPIEDVLRSATGDPRLSVAYRIGADGAAGLGGGAAPGPGGGGAAVPGPDGGGDGGRWVASNGREAAAPADPAATVIVRRDGAPVARVAFDPARADRRLVEAVAARARPELDNTSLRAALTLQLVEVADSRARIAAAQLAERQRIERNLHDGAQQRLLALGLELRSAQMNGGPDRLAAAVEAGIDLAQAALVELRDLAHGLCPPVLADGGLAAALDDLAAHAPVPLLVTSTDARFAPAVEQTAWFVVCEAVANAAKHAQASAVTVTAGTLPSADVLTVTVADDGRGGADPAGRGLQGLRDRAEAVGGTLAVVSPPAGGTEVRLLLPAKERPPCGS